MKLVPNSVDAFFYHYRIEVKLVKRILTDCCIPIGVYLTWLFSTYNPIDDFRLITDSSIAKGKIISAKNESGDIEIADNGRTSEQSYYDYTYSFVLTDGKTMRSTGSERGNMPEYLIDSDMPVSVDVEYLSDNPVVSRVKGMSNHETTVLQWIRHNMVLPTIIILVLCYCGYISLRNGLKEYKLQKAKVVSNEKSNYFIA